MNRIEQITSSHPWISEDACRIMLCSYYKRFCEVGLEGQRLQYFMDETTKSICNHDRKHVQETLSMIVDWH